MANIAWRIGDFTITRLFEVGEQQPNPGGGPQSLLPHAYPEAIKAIPWMAPDWADENGYLRMSLHALLVEADGFKLIVDTCVGNHKPRKFPALSMLQTGFLNDLEAAGWSRLDVDGVICTHLHVDHVGWNTMLHDGQWVPTFPKARYYMGREELDFALAELDSTTEGGNLFTADSKACFLDSVKPVIDAGLHEAVESNAQIRDGIRLMPTPGHTPGHVSVILESNGERAVITGDMMHHPCQIAHPEWSSIADHDPERSHASRLSFLDGLADTQTLVIGTHFGGPTAGCVYREGQQFWFDGRGKALRYRLA